MPGYLEGKNAVVFGVANKRSIAWAITQKLQQAGASLAVTYQNERLKLEAEEMITSLPGAKAYQCDVTRDEEITSLYEQLKQRWEKLDVLVHSVAYAPADDLKGEFISTSREGF